MHVLEEAHNLGVYAPLLEEASMLRHEGSYPFSLVVREPESRQVGPRVGGLRRPPQGDLSDHAVEGFHQINEEDEDAEFGGGCIRDDFAHQVRGKVGAASAHGAMLALRHGGVVDGDNAVGQMLLQAFRKVVL